MMVLMWGGGFLLLITRGPTTFTSSTYSRHIITVGHTELISG